MRIVVLSLIVVLAASLYFLGLAGIVLPEGAETAAHAVMIVAGFWLVGEGIAARKLAAETARLAADTTKARDELGHGQRDLKRVQDDLKKLQDELKRAQEEARRGRHAQDELVRVRQDATETLEAERKRNDRFERAAQEAKAALAKVGHEEVVNLLALLQQKGRFLDFIMDDVTKYPDAQIGAAARVVHQGCSQVVREYFEIKPVHDGSEGQPLTLEKDYDAQRYRLLGRVTGEPPFRGRVLHRGWVASTVRLPERIESHGLPQTTGRGIIAPAEVELS